MRRRKLEQAKPPVNTVVALLDFIVYYLLGLLKLLLIV